MPDSPAQSPSSDAARRLPRPWDNPAQVPFIQIKGLSKRFDDVTAVNDVSLDIFRGELFAILGGSGSGKTTLLRMLAGFEQPAAGSIVIDGVDMTPVPPYERPVNMMFQSYALFPHMTVEQNVAYGLRKEGLPRADIARRVAEMLALVKLGSLGGRKPDQLSGGEQQRVALARALVKRPKVLLLDEPLAALDRKLREHTQFELMNIQDQLGITFLVVTHDQEEAMTLATRIAVMNAGRFVQVGTPAEIYEFPCNRFVADFFGTVNLFSGRVAGNSGDTLSFRADNLPGVICAPATTCQTGDEAWIAVRPEKISLSKAPPAGSDENVFRGMVWDLAYYGNLSLYQINLDGGHIIEVSVQNRVRSAQRVAEWYDEVYVYWGKQNSVVLRE
ncbi:MAG: ABC transporter ATP-binding protein [Gammaproteobacteria bacterium]|nr:ABC transporter ATP-binding protein [Gammaproteobacteria bacterium]